MADESVVIAVTGYLRELRNLGLPVEYGILFGSHARGDSADRWSDIDLLVVSPRYDEKCDREELTLLWKIAARVDSRIEPFPVGTRRWDTDDESTIIEVARREGIRISV
ncbi:MAG: nucleotidyltransferase domain-containing protein [Thermodesulfobacteriota bacterium]